MGRNLFPQKSRFLKVKKRGRGARRKKNLMSGKVIVLGGGERKQNMGDGIKWPGIG